jgi:pantoate kinase
MAIAIGLAVVLHVIDKLSPNSAANCGVGVGCGYGIGGSVVLVLFLGLIVGLGLGMGMAAAVPEMTADSPAPHHATPTDQPPAPSA